MKKQNIDVLIEQITKEANKLNNLLEVYPSFNQNNTQTYNNQLATNNKPYPVPVNKTEKIDNSIKKSQIELDKYKDIQSKRAYDAFNMEPQEVNNKIKELQGQQQFKIAQKEQKGNNINA